MGTDYVKPFDLSLARRLLKMEPAAIAAYVDQNRAALEARDRRAAESDLASFRARLEEKEWREAVGRLARVERWADLVKQLASGTDGASLRREAVDALAMSPERINLDYWGCWAEVFVKPPPGSLSSRALFPDDKEELFVLLLPTHVNVMLTSLQRHRSELSVMNDRSLARLTALRDDCARNSDLRVAYCFDF